MDGLGRLFNVIAVADGVYVPLTDGQAVTFVCYLDGGDTFTITEAQAAAGTGAQVLAAVDHYYTGSGVGGAWSEHELASAASAVTTTDSTILDCAVFTVEADSLSDGYTHLKCAATGSGTVVALLHDLRTQRTPQNLPALV